MDHCIQLVMEAKPHASADGQPPQLELLRSPSLAEQVAESIIAAIADGTLAYGQRVLETEIARQLGVSRIPVREALKTLAAQGLLAVAPHRGARVAELDDTKIDRICEVRVELERLAVRDAQPVLRADRRALQRLDDAVRAMERSVRDKDWIGVNRADLDFHRAICLASGNEIVLTLWDTLARHVRVILGREILGERERTGVVAHHRALRALLLDGSEPEARAGIAAHIMRLRARRAAAQEPRARLSPRRRPA
jgi:DNA-binding GntR family transcriptional regulator